MWIPTVRKRERVFRVGERENGTERDGRQSFRNGGRGKTRNASKGRDGRKRGLRAEEEERERERRDREKREQIGDSRRRGKSRETEGEEFTWRRWRKGGGPLEEIFRSHGAEFIWTFAKRRVLALQEKRGRERELAR